MTEEHTASRAAQEELVALLEELESRKKTNKLVFDYPATGRFSRDKYPKHLEVFDATKDCAEIIFMAGNRCGKTFAGSHLIAYAATGLYPDWWTGRRWNRPVTIWACGESGATTRDIVQKELLGERTELGSGTIPKNCIIDTKAKPGIPDGIETLHVKHVSGGTSVITFKSYDSGRSKFVGVALDICWLDELPDDPALYLECQIRLMTKKGLSIVTATPDKGMSPTVLSFWPDGKVAWGSLANGHKYTVNMTWDQAPHLDTGEQERLMAQMLPHEREAKIKGIPYLGAGQVYPILEEDYTCKPFELPERWLRCAGLDVGWNRTACVWLAHNPNDGVTYVYSEHYRGQAEPSVHAQGIKARGAWMPIAVDPAARGRSQVDGLQLIEMYGELGLDVFKADNQVEAGILNVFDRLSSGKLKIFSTCENLLGEMRLYRRSSDGKILKKNDHACDALRYAIMSGLDCAMRPPIDSDSDDSAQRQHGTPDKSTGY